ncbi:MAG: hypothetical protein M3Q34_02370 [bacterium]|nr:hypothetical protein [bacterium]
MSKTKIILTFVLIVIALGGYGLIFQKSKLENTAPMVSNEFESETKVQPTGKKMAFSEFIKQDKGAYKCEVKQAFSDMENSGTIYMNNGMMRGEFSTIAEGQPMDSSFIMKDGYAYNWSSTLPSMGVKVKVLTSADDNGREAKETYTWNAEQIGEYNCEEWKVDESKFALPTRINFTELSSPSSSQ